MTTFKAIIRNGKLHHKNDGSTNVKIRITHNRRADYISTELFVTPEVFDVRAGVVRLGKNKSYINLRILDYYSFLHR